MKKEDLVKLGLADDVAQKVAEASATELKGFVPQSRLNEVIAERDALKTSVTERDTQLETLKKSTGDVTALTQQITQLQADNKTKDDQHKAELHKLKVDAAVEKALLSAKAKNLTATKALLSAELLEKAEFAEDGTLKGLSDAIEKLVKAEDTKFLFDTGKKATTPKGYVPAEKKDGTPGADKPLTLADAIRARLESEEQ